MAISATRFEGFSRDFNIPIKDFNSIREVGVFNTPETGFKDFLESAQDMAEQVRSNFIEGLGVGKGLLNDVKDLGKGATSAVSEAMRMAKGVFDNVANLASASSDMINGIIDNIFEGFPKDIMNALKSVGALCRNEAVATGISLGLNVGHNVNCSGLGIGSNNCPPSSTRGLSGAIGGPFMDGVSGVLGAIGKGLSAIKNGIQALSSLLSVGYSANLCNVFSSVVDKLGVKDLSVIGIAAAGMLSKEGLKGSISAAVDIAKNNVGNVAALAPSAIRNTAQNLTIGPALNSDNIKHVSNSVTSSFDSLDNFWNTSEKGYVSTAKTGDYNEAMGKIVDYQRTTTTFDTSDINKVNESSSSAYSSAYSAQPPVVAPPPAAPVTITQGKITEYGEPYKDPYASTREVSARQKEIDRRDAERGYSAKQPIFFGTDEEFFAQAYK